jgi:hypothetical protein
MVGSAGRHGSGVYFSRLDTMDPMSEPTTLTGVIERLRAIDADLPTGDGAAVFNRMYLTVTERIAARLADPADGLFADDALIGDLDVRFAALWLHAYAGAAAGHRTPTAWAPLFEARHSSRWTVQFALAGMNTHIEHDLPLAVVRTCQAHDLEPADLRKDYEAVNVVLAEVEGEVRRTFLAEVGRELDDRVGPVVHLASSWNIVKAREVAWVTAETIWELRRTEFLLGRFLSGLGHTVGMASRALLTPV